MKHLSSSIVGGLVLVGTFLAAACSSSDGSSTVQSNRGALGQAPKDDGTCNAGLLVCSGLCQTACTVTTSTPTGTTVPPMPTTTVPPMPMPTGTVVVPPQDAGPALDATTADATVQPDAAPIDAAVDAGQPDAAPAAKQVLDVAVTFGTTCAVVGLGTQGSVYCWGSDQNGSLGQGAAVATGQSLTPLEVSGAGSAVVAIEALAAGGFCSVAADGEMRCWGAGFTSAPGVHPLFGQDVAHFTGNCVVKKSTGAVACDNGTPGAPAVAEVAAVGTQVKKLIGIKMAGWNHCAIAQNDKVFCWGANNHFRAGVAPQDTAVAMNEIPGLLASDIVFSGRATAAVDMSGTAWFWGDVPAPGISSLEPFPGSVSVKPGKVAMYSQLALLGSTWDHFFLVGVDGKIAVTGPPFGASSQQPFPGIGYGTPFGVPGVTFKKMRTTPSVVGTACAISKAGSLYCWGTNDLGQAGSGTTTPVKLPQVVAGLPQ
jgi:Regulator of chromosome condensation (RCC1) repeat